MITLHLCYGSLKHKLNRHNGDIIFHIKNIHIHALLYEILPLDIVNIIYNYTFEIITLPCSYSRNIYEKLYINHDDYTFIIYIYSNNHYALSVHSHTICYINSLVGLPGDYYPHVINTFMKYMYNKTNYIDTNEHGNCLMNGYNITYTSDDGFCNFHIINCKKMKYLCIIIKCILRGICKFKKMKTTT